MNKNLNTILGVELICAAQGIEFRKPLNTSPTLEKVLRMTRKVIPQIKADRYFADDIANASRMVATGELVNAADLRGYVRGEVTP